MLFVNVTTDQCLLLKVLFFKAPQVLPRDRTQITKKKKNLNVWKKKFSLLNLQFCRTRIVVQVQLVEPAVCFSDLQACEEMIHSFIRQKQKNIMLRQHFCFNIYEPKLSIYDIYTSQ